MKINFRVDQFLLQFFFLHEGHTREIKHSSCCLLRRNPGVGPLRPSLPRGNDQRGGFEACLRGRGVAGARLYARAFISSFHHPRLKVYQASRASAFPLSLSFLTSWEERKRGKKKRKKREREERKWRKISFSACGII